jgi:hypothetical protein
LSEKSFYETTILTTYGIQDKPDLTMIDLPEQVQRRLTRNMIDWAAITGQEFKRASKVLSSLPEREQQ